MTDKTRNQRQQALKAKRKAEGLVRLELWIKPEHKEQIKAYAAFVGRNADDKQPAGSA